MSGGCARPGTRVTRGDFDGVDAARQRIDNCTLVEYRRVPVVCRQQFGSAIAHIGAAANHQPVVLQTRRHVGTVTVAGVRGG